MRGAVLDEEGRVLLVRHGYTRGWHLPGGGVEAGESLIDALVRELREEGNVEVKGAPALHGIFQNPGASPRDHVAVFIVREFDWNGPHPPGWEIREAAFFPVNALPEGTTAGTRRRLAEILNGATQSRRW